nr:zinc finger, CCHC-type [Tanacetum cinerariifolium]
MLSYSGLSKGFWGEAMLTACYVINRVSNKGTRLTHMNVGKNRFSSISRPKVVVQNLKESQRDDHSDNIPSEIPEPRKALSDLPPCCKPLGIDKFKAQLVIQGFRRKEGIDYFDTHALIARITTIRLLLTLAAIHNLVVHQMDVKTSFLNGDLIKKCI